MDFEIKLEFKKPKLIKLKANINKSLVKIVKIED